MTEARRIRHDSMKQKLIRLSQRYVTALRKHLEQGPQASMLPALGLGRRAVALGLETLDMARIHERAVTTLELSSRKDGFIERAQIFFTESITPIEETHPAARKAKTHLRQLTECSGGARGTGRHQRPVAAGHCPAQDREAAAEEKRQTLRQPVKTFLQAERFAATDAPGGPRAQEDERQKISHHL